MVGGTPEPTSLVLLGSGLIGNGDCTPPQKESVIALSKILQQLLEAVFQGAASFVLTGSREHADTLLADQPLRCASLPDPRSHMEVAGRLMRGDFNHMGQF